VSIQTATDDFEGWLGQYVALVEDDLDHKHTKMASRTSAFPFFRGTFYRWAQKFPKVCPDLADAPSVIAVGDLHVQNFGTWRDADGRLAWGVNDLDEACEMPYTSDLVRLAASAVLQAREQGWGQTPDDACAAVATGYAAGLRARLDSRARPVLIESHAWLSRLRPQNDPSRFWRDLKDLVSGRHTVPQEAIAVIRTVLPSEAVDCRVAPRTAGMGSLGRPRYCAVGDWCGGPIAREAKAAAPSAWSWARSSQPTDPEQVLKMLFDENIRAPDPVYRVARGWVLRRLAPDCDKIDDAVHEREGRVLRLMGVETANVQGISEDRLRDVSKDLESRPDNWLRSAVKDMLKCVRSDWESWQETHGG
jgi:hypothetical protein